MNIAMLCKRLEGMIIRQTVTEDIFTLQTAVEQLAASRAELRKLIIAAKEAREVAAIFFRALDYDQIDCVLGEIAQAGIAPAFGTRLQDAIAAAEAVGGEGK